MVHEARTLGGLEEQYNTQGSSREAAECKNYLQLTHRVHFFLVCEQSGVSKAIQNSILCFQMELGWLYIPFPSLSTTALFFIFHGIDLPNAFFSPTEMKSSFCDGDLHSHGRALEILEVFRSTWIFLTHLGIFPFKKTVRTRNFPLPSLQAIPPCTFLQEIKLQLSGGSCF